MSAFNAVAIVGSDTMKMRVATPEMNCPTIALTRSSTSMCLAMRRGREHCRTRVEVRAERPERAGPRQSRGELINGRRLLHDWKASQPGSKASTMVGGDGPGPGTLRGDAPPARSHQRS